MSARFVQVYPSTDLIPRNPFHGAIGIVDDAFWYRTPSGSLMAMAGAAPLVLTANTVLTAESHGGRTLVVNKLDGITLTLPPATGSGVKFRIVIGATLTSGTFVLRTASASDVMRGRAIVAHVAADTHNTFETANTGVIATESDTMTWNRTTTGVGTIGDEVEVEDILTPIWAITALPVATTPATTPFSAAV